MRRSYFKVNGDDTVAACQFRCEVNFFRSGCDEETVAVGVWYIVGTNNNIFCTSLFWINCKIETYGIGATVVVYCIEFNDNVNLVIFIPIIEIGLNIIP